MLKIVYTSDGQQKPARVDLAQPRILKAYWRTVGDGHDFSVIASVLDEDLTTKRMPLALTLIGLPPDVVMDENTTPEFLLALEAANAPRHVLDVFGLPGLYHLLLTDAQIPASTLFRFVVIAKY